MSGDFYIRFDNAYYSVDKAYLHKSVVIAVSATTINIYSMKGELIVSWHRASRRGEWLTNPAHIPDSYKKMSEWNATYFVRKAMTVGPNTVKVIEHILKSMCQLKSYGHEEDIFIAHLRAGGMRGLQQRQLL